MPKARSSKTKEEELDEEETVEGGASEAPATPKTEAPNVKKAYTKVTLRKIRELEAAGRELSGDETEEVIDTMHEAMELEEGGEEATEAEEIDGAPNHLTPRFEPLRVGGKDVNFPVFFVAAVKGGTRLYNERGQAVSGVMKTAKEQAYIAKAAARNNAIRRSNRLPEEFAQG